MRLHSLTPPPPGKTCHLSAIFSPFPAPSLFLVSCRAASSSSGPGTSFCPRSSLSAACRSLHHLDAVLVIEIEDEEVGEEKCGLRGGVRQLSYASRCKQGRRPTLSVRQPAARVRLSTPPLPDSLSAFQAQVKPPSVRPSPPFVSSQPPKGCSKNSAAVLLQITSAINAA